MRGRWTFLFIITILLTACGTPAATSQQQQQPTSVVPGDTPVAVSSSTPAPTATPTPTPAPTLTPTPTATPALLNMGRGNFDQFVQVQTFRQVLETATGKDLSDLRIDALAYSPDGRFMAVGGCTGVWSGNCISDVFGGHSFLLILDARTAEIVTTLPETEVTVTGLAFNSDGEKLVYATNPDRIILWDVALEKIEKVLWQARGSGYRRVAISPDGSMVAEVNSTTLKVWDTVSGKVLTQKPGGNNGDKLPRFSADGTRLAAGSTDTGLEIAIYDTTTWQTVAEISLPYNKSPVRLDISPDFRLVATANGVGNVDVLLWDGETGLQVGALHDPFFAGIDSVGFTPDVQLLLVSGTPSDAAPYNQPFSVWDVASRQNLGRIFGQDLLYSRIIFSDDGTAFTTGGTLWSLPNEPLLDARAAVTDFITALNEGNYEAAATAYKPYVDDADYFNSLGVDATDIPALLEFVCGMDSQPCMPLREILYAGRESLGDYGLLVSFTAPDGSVYTDEYGFNDFWFYGDI